MVRTVSGCMIWLICSILILPATAQTKDSEPKDLTLEVAQLKRKIADQEVRIAQLEKAMKAMQENGSRAGNIADAILKLEAAVRDLKAIPAPQPIPPLTPPWYSASNWNLLMRGMSRSQVEEILGPPSSESKVMDVDTWYYSTDSRATTTLKGSVTFTGDRVTVMIPPAF
jgi:hypothetical protein